MSTEHGQQPQSGGRRGRGPGDKKPRRRSRRKETYSMYIYKVLKQVRGASAWSECTGLGRSLDPWERGLGLAPALGRVASRRLCARSVSAAPSPSGAVTHLCRAGAM